MFGRGVGVWVEEWWRVGIFTLSFQCAKRVVSDNLGLEDFVIGLVINPAHHHQFLGGLVILTFGLVHASCSLLNQQAVKLAFFTPCFSLFSPYFCKLMRKYTLQFPFSVSFSSMLTHMVYP